MPYSPCCAGTSSAPRRTRPGSPVVVHRFAQSGRIEWIALVFLQRYFEAMHGHAWQDVHDDHRPDIRDVDFHLDGVSADLKADTYFADLRGETRAATRYRKRDSGCLALETVSTDFSHRWQNDRAPDPAQPRMSLGWMHTSRAEQIWYYFLALDNAPDELDALTGEGARQQGAEVNREQRLLDTALVHRDELLILPAAPLKAWFWANLDHFDRRGARNPAYTTWFRRVPRSVLLKENLVARRIPNLAQEVLAWHRGCG